MRPSLIPVSLLPVVSALLLAGCGEEPAATLSGAVVKGITANAVITAYSPDGTELATGLSDAQGGYSLSLPPGYSGAVRLVGAVSTDPGTVTVTRCDALSGCGVFAEASAHDIDADMLVDFGEWLPTPADFSLTAVTVAEAGVLQPVNLSPVSSMAAAWAVEFPQGLDARSAVAANERAAEVFGLQPGDLLLPAGDITDPLWVNVASVEQVRAALVYATFAEAASRYGLSTQWVVDTVAGSFASQNGRILQADTDPSVNLAFLLPVARDLAVNLAMPEETRTALVGELDTTIATLTIGEYTAHRQVTVDELLDKLGALGDQLNQLRLITGLDDFENFLTTQEPYFSWLWSEDNLKIAPLGVEVVLYSLISSVFLDTLDASSPPMVLLSDNCGFTLTLNPATKTLRWQGPRFGQTVDLTVSLTALRAGLLSNRFDYGIAGIVDNPVAAGEIAGTLSVDLGDTDLTPMFNALFNGDNLALKQALYDLAYSLEATVTLDGTAQLVRHGDFDPAQVLGGGVSLVGTIDLGALEGETIATLNVATANLELPNGTRFYGLPGTPVLSVTVADHATVIIDGAGEVLGIPTAYAHAEGTLFNARVLFEHVRGVLTGALLQESPDVDLPELVMSVFDFDFSQLSATGEGVITIPELGHEYRATLDDMTVTVYQPHSTDVAMTATLDVPGLAVNFMLGDEAWVQRLHTTPQLRMTLEGPDGQLAEITQQDVMDFLSPVLDTLFGSDLFAGIGEISPSDCGGSGGGDGGGGGTPTAPAIGLSNNGTATDHVIAGTAGLHVNFTGALPKSIENYFARWYLNGTHLESLDALLAGEIPTGDLAVGTHVVRIELSDLTGLVPATVRISQTFTVRPQPTVIAPDTSILDGVSISIRQNGVEIRRAPEGAENIEVSLVGFNPPEGSNYLLRWYLNGVHYPAYDNQMSASALVNPLTRGNYMLRLEITNLDAPTLSTVRMAEMVVVTEGETGGSAGVALLGLLSLLWARRSRPRRH